MKANEWAQLLTGREYGMEVTKREQVQANADGIVIVYAYSDDNMEFSGAINDEVSCYGGGTAYIDPAKKDLFRSECPADLEYGCPCLSAAKDRCIPIEAVWRDSPDSPPWTYKTGIPHETFLVMEDGEVWCRGIVFTLDALDAD